MIDFELISVHRVGDRNKYEIHLPLPPKIDPTVTMMQVCVYVCVRGAAAFDGCGKTGLTSLSTTQVEEKPDVTYGDVGGCKEQIEKLKEVVEMPLLHVS